MSIVSMTNVAFARRTDTAPEIPAGVSGVNAAAHGEEQSNDAITNAMGVAIAYFPSEINVLYTAIIAAIATTSTSSHTGQWVAFVFVLALTPIAVWFVYAARVRADGKALPLQPKSWPIAEWSWPSLPSPSGRRHCPGLPYKTSRVTRQRLRALLSWSLRLCWAGSPRCFSVPSSHPQHRRGRLQTNRFRTSQARTNRVRTNRVRTKMNRRLSLGPFARK
jgi:hypothetical protein